MSRPTERARREAGTALVEYALIIGLVVLVGFSGFNWFNDRLEEQFEDISSSFASDVPGGDLESDPEDDSDPDEESDSGPDGDPADDPDGGSDPADDPDGGEEAEEEDPPADPVDDTASEDVAATDSGSEFEWWTDKWYGGFGEWEASVTFENDWTEDQILTLEVTVTESDGDSGTTTVQLFVPADGSASYTVGDLWIQETYWSGITGDETVDVTVMNIATIDGSGEPVEYETDGPTITVSAPNTN